MKTARKNEISSTNLKTAPKTKILPKKLKKTAQKTENLPTNLKLLRKLKFRQKI